MSWYRIGTVSVTNANPTITGAGGTSWAANIQAGDAFKGPDDKLYEVQSVSSDTSITLGSNYLGTTATGAAYAIIPTQGRVRDLAAAVLQLITDLGDVDSALTVVSGRVGLGKSPNASARLDVSGQVWVDAPSGDATLRMLVSAAEKGKLGVTSAGRAYIESNGAEVMTWLNGNVGANTAVFGSSNTSGLSIEPYVGGVIANIGHNNGAASSDAYMNFRRSGTVLGSIFQDSSTGIGMNSAGLLRLRTGDTDRVVIDGSGNVGIGRTPAVALDVNGALSLANLTSTSAANYTLLPTDATLRVQATCSLTMPAASGFPGRRLRVFNVGAFAVTSAAGNDVVPQGGSAAGGAILAATAGKWADLESNGSSWWIAAGN